MKRLIILIIAGVFILLAAALVAGVLILKTVMQHGFQDEDED